MDVQYHSRLGFWQTPRGKRRQCDETGWRDAVIFTDAVPCHSPEWLARDAVVAQMRVQKTQYPKSNIKQLMSGDSGQTHKKRGSLREEMLVVTRWIDEMRAAFGADTIDQAIRSGVGGEPTFYARENGRELGVKCPPSRFDGLPRISSLDRGWCRGCHGECVGTARECERSPASADF